MKDLELEKKLERTEIKIDISKLTKSKINQIVLPLHRFIEWKGLDIDGKYLRKTEIFDNCLSNEDASKAKQLNKIYMTRICNLLDDDVKKDMNFDDFVS